MTMSPVSPPTPPPLPFADVPGAFSPPFSPKAHQRRTPDPPRPEGLTVEERLRYRAFDFEFFQAVLVLERLRPGWLPVGRASSPGSEPVHFEATLSHNFPASAIQEVSWSTDGDAAREPIPMRVNFMGLTGPSGVLPRHYTQALLDLRRDRKDAEKHAPRDWLNLFDHRWIALFFRAWEKYRFWVAYGRGEHADRDPDVFTEALFSLVGLGGPTLKHRLRVSVPAGAPGADEQPLAEVRDLSLLYYGGLLRQRPRSAVNLEALLADYFQVPVSVRQFQGQWLDLEPESHSRLGVGSAFNRLGRDAIVGNRVWDMGNKARIRLGPLSYRQLLEFFPDHSPTSNRKAFFLLGHLVRLFVGPELDFDVQLVLRRTEVPRIRLVSDHDDAPRLGWNTWLGTEPPAHDVDDAVLQPEALRWIHPPCPKRGQEHFSRSLGQKTDHATSWPTPEGMSGTSPAKNAPDPLFDVRPKG